MKGPRVTQLGQQTLVVATPFNPPSASSLPEQGGASRAPLRGWQWREALPRILGLLLPPMVVDFVAMENSGL